jgi:hypothetical protein
MSLSILTPGGLPGCEHTDHLARVTATRLVPVLDSGGRIRRWVAVCDYHTDYGDGRNRSIPLNV